MRYDDYDLFADIYNRHWGQFGIQVTSPLNRLGLSDLEPGDRILDLCCGTGQLAAVLTGQGLSVVGVDGSTAMIEHARRNAPAAEFLVEDAREFTLDPPVAMAVSTFDSLNHVMTIEDLSRVFGHVFDVLEPGGRFIFDLNIAAGFSARWQGAFTIDDPGEFIVAVSSYDEDERIGQMKFTWFTQSGDYWQRSAVTLTQRCYAVDEVIGALGAAGFEGIDVTDAADLVEGWQSGRVFFVAVRPR